MKLSLRALCVAALVCLPLAAADLQRDVLSITYSKEKGLVAAAFRGGQVVVWDFETGHVKNIYNASGPRNTLNQPLAHFNVSGSRLAFTQEGDTGLVAYDTKTGSSTAVVPRRLLVQGISAFNWAGQGDSMLVAIGRDILFVTALGHVQWQRRLETRALITAVAWHPTDLYYTVATDDGVVSNWETSSGRVISSSKLDAGKKATPVQVGWTSEDALVASIKGISLSVLDPETLKPKKVASCDCFDVAWSPNGREIFAWVRPNIAVFGEGGQHMRDLHAAFDGESPIVWVGEGRLLTASTGSMVALRDSRSAKIMRTFAP